MNLYTSHSNYVPKSEWDEMLRTESGGAGATITIYEGGWPVEIVVNAEEDGADEVPLSIRAAAALAISEYE